MTELRHALDMQAALESLVEEGNYCKVSMYLIQFCFMVYDPQKTSFFFVVGIIVLPLITLLKVILHCSSFLQAFQVLSEYLQLLDSFSELSAMQEMSRGVEVDI